MRRDRNLSESDEVIHLTPPSTHIKKNTCIGDDVGVFFSALAWTFPPKSRKAFSTCHLCDELYAIIDTLIKPVITNTKTEEEPMLGK